MSKKIHKLLPDFIPDFPHTSSRCIIVNNDDNIEQAVEVRVGHQPIKAEWLRIELVKVETLPGSGLNNTFYDFVGTSPVTLWQQNDQSNLLHNVSWGLFVCVCVCFGSGKGRMLWTDLFSSPSCVLYLLEGLSIRDTHTRVHPTNTTA